MTILITGKAYYAKVFQPEVPSNPKWSSRWKISVVVSDKHAEELKQAGLRIQPANEYIPGNHVEVIRYTKNGKGEEVSKPDVVDGCLEPMTDLIGNGSEVNVSAYFNPSSDMKHPRLDAVQVVTLVPLAGSGPRGVNAFSRVEGGHTKATAPVGNSSDDDTPFDMGDEVDTSSDSRLV